MIDDQQRLIFVENPKTASCSLRTALMGEDYLSNPYDPRMGTIGHHIPRILKSKYPAKWQNYMSMVVVRNTWDRAHSYFTYIRDYSGTDSYQDCTFDEWVKEDTPPAKHDLIRGPLHVFGLIDDMLDQMRYVDDVDEVIVMDSPDRNRRVSQLNEGLARIKKKHGIEAGAIPKDENNQGRTDKVIPWKEETIDRLYEQHREEIELFNFQPPKIQ